MISALANEVYRNLVIEHAIGMEPYNWENRHTTPIMKSMSRKFSSFTDVFRTYDAPHHSIPSTLDRVASILPNAQTDGKDLGLINSEDEVYLCSAMGLIIGAMRYPIGDEPAGSLPNIYLGGGDNAFTRTRPLRKMFDEVRRAVMWY